MRTTECICTTARPSLVASLGGDCKEKIPFFFEISISLCLQSPPWLGFWGDDFYCNLIVNLLLLRVLRDQMELDLLFCTVQCCYSFYMHFPFFVIFRFMAHRQAETLLGFGRSGCYF